MNDPEPPGWFLLVPKFPAEPSRHRIAMWRRLRRLGAVTVASGAWAVPNLPDISGTIADLRTQAHAPGGALAVYAVTGAGQEDTELLREAFAAARREEWAELVSDCGAFEAEIERHIATGASTYEHLEQSSRRMARMRRRQHELVQRNPFAMPEAQDAAAQLDAATTRLAHYSELMFARTRQMAQASNRATLTQHTRRVTPGTATPELQDRARAQLPEQ